LSTLLEKSASAFNLVNLVLMGFCAISVGAIAQNLSDDKLKKY
jgi:hypothetical protein